MWRKLPPLATIRGPDPSEFSHLWLTAVVMRTRQEDVEEAAALGCCQVFPGPPLHAALPHRLQRLGRFLIRDEYSVSTAPAVATQNGTSGHIIIQGDASAEPVSVFDSPGAPAAGRGASAAAQTPGFWTARNPRRSRCAKIQIRLHRSKDDVRRFDSVQAFRISFSCLSIAVLHVSSAVRPTSPYIALHRHNIQKLTHLPCGHVWSCKPPNMMDHRGHSLLKASATPEPGTSGRPATLVSAKARQVLSKVDTSRRSPQWAPTGEGLCNAGARDLRPPRHAHVDQMRQRRVVARMHRLVAGVAGHQRPQPKVRRIALPCIIGEIKLLDVLACAHQRLLDCQKHGCTAWLPACRPPPPAAKSAAPRAVTWRSTYGFGIGFSNVHAPPGCQRRPPPAPAAKRVTPHAALQANV